MNEPEQVLLRTEIVKVEESGGFILETWRNERGIELSLTISDGPLPAGIPTGRSVKGVAADLPFEQVRPLAVALLRAVYFQSPSGWGWLAEEDPQEYIAHLAELLYDASSERNPVDPIVNLLSVVKDRNDALRQIGIAKRETLKWKRRYENAAGWARRNALRMHRQRQEIGRLQCTPHE